MNPSICGQMAKVASTTKTNPGKLGFATAELENDNVLKVGY